MNVYRDGELPVNPGGEFLKPTFYFDADSETVRAFAQKAAGDVATNTGKAVKLFYAVRDGIRYDPYRILVKREEFRASEILQSQSAYCVPKAIALVTAARAV